MPLLYGPGSDETDAAPLVTPSEEEMARYLRQQLSAAGVSTAQAGRGRTPAIPESLASLVTSDGRAANAESARAEPSRGRRRDDEALPLPSPPHAPQQPLRQGAADTLVQGRASLASAALPVPASVAASTARAAPGAHGAPSNTPSVPAPPPGLKHIGRFSGLKRQGRTDAGTLYRATDPRTGSEVALHVLQGAACESDTLRPLLLKQLQAAARLSHPNIAAVDEVDVDQGQPFLVSAALDAETLSQRLQTQGPLPVREAVELGLQLARALDHAHQNRIPHLGLKPANVLLLAPSPQLQLTGFGMALGSNDVAVGVGPASPAAARHYMTPEQTRGEPQDARSDIFAAGVVLYEMLSGERPFRGSTPLALAARIANDEPSPLQPLRPEVPASLRRVVDRCLAKAPAQRYASAKDLGEALLRVLGEMESAQLQGSAARRLSLRTVWAALAGVASVAVVGVVAAAAAMWQVDAVRKQAHEQGRDLARFIAAQHAQQVLSEDWAAVSAQALPAMQALGGERLAMTDAAGLVRMSSVPAQLGQPFSPEGAAQPPTAADGTQVRDVGARLDFDAPIVVQGKTLGRVVLGLPAPRLLRASESTGGLFALLAVVAGLMAAALAYAFARWLDRPIAATSEALAAVGKGRFDLRMPVAGNREFGRLYAAVDTMALGLQRREGGQGKAGAAG